MRDRLSIIFFAILVISILLILLGAIMEIQGYYKMSLHSKKALWAAVASGFIYIFVIEQAITYIIERRTVPVFFFIVWLCCLPPVIYHEYVYRTETRLLLPDTVDIVLRLYFICYIVIMWGRQKLKDYRSWSGTA